MNIKEIGSLILVGAGQMGSALAKGWLAHGMPGSALTLVDPTPGKATHEFAKSNGVLLLEEMPKTPADVLVLAVKPQIAGQVMKQIRDDIGPETLVLSVVAGYSLASLSAHMGTTRIVRTMPNTPAQVGKGVTGAVAGSGVSYENREMADAVLGASGRAVWLEQEDQINALTAVSGSGPAYVFLMVEAMAAAGVAEGLDPEISTILARETVIGAAALMDADPTEAAILRKNVTSPNGVTAEGLAVLMAEPGLGELMGRAVAAARRRNIELGE